ncbi:MAG: recombination mediator RecR [Chlamydiales bacterium]
MAKYPKNLLNLMHLFSKFTGVGKKTAERFAFQVISWSNKDRERFANILINLSTYIHNCSVCGCLIEKSECPFCSPIRDSTVMCVVASSKDVFVLEGTQKFTGMYHVLGGLLSPIDGINPEVLRIAELHKRICQLQVREIILAFDFTFEGDATAIYLKKILDDIPLLRISRLALGIPLGSSLDYIDSQTLSKSLSGRQSF